jgi:hypothetical protein
VQHRDREHVQRRSPSALHENDDKPVAAVLGCED